MVAFEEFIELGLDEFHRVGGIHAARRLLLGLLGRCRSSLAHDGYPPLLIETSLKVRRYHSGKGLQYAMITN
jgi:hypothetical protein